MLFIVIAFVAFWGLFDIFIGLLLIVQGLLVMIFGPSSRVKKDDKLIVWRH